MTGSSATPWQATAIALAVLLLTCLVGLGRPLWSPDEPREAEISREMLLSPGVVPTLDGGTFIEKPPLYYLSVAGVFALTGNVSPATARSVSVLAGFGTLLLVFLWGRREFSTPVGIVAALGLATSERFLISSHWILSDPLLMLFTTAALWAGWELLRKGTWVATACFYVALVAALWTKGLIGPVLIGSGLAVYCALGFREAPWRRLRVFTGSAVMVAATAALALAIYQSAGTEAVREWFWVNHVLRFVAPQGTGHEGPFYYYLAALPIALLPWWAAAVDSFRPRSWARAIAGGVRRYWALMALGMVVLLSISVTKRELYLLPALPPLFLFIAAHVVDAWSGPAANLRRSVKWWLQVGLSAAFAIGPVAGVIAYEGAASAPSIAYLLGTAGIAAAAVVFGIRRQARAALMSLASLGVAGAIGLMGVVPGQLDPYKNMEPFLDWANTVLPQDGMVYAIGHIDETLEGIVPFTTGRKLVPLTSDELSSVQPTFVLVQDTGGGLNLPQLPESFQPIREVTFGIERYMGLWRSTDDSVADAKCCSQSRSHRLDPGKPKIDDLRP